MAWEFTTASEATNTARLMRMREEAFSEIGEGHAPYTIDSRQVDAGGDNLGHRVETAALLRTLGGEEGGEPVPDLPRRQRAPR